MARSPHFGKHPAIEYNPVIYDRRVGNQPYSLAEILIAIYCTIDLQLDKQQTRDVLYNLKLSDREPTAISGILRFWLLNPPERPENRNFVLAWGWPRLRKDETMLQRLTGEGFTGRRETISRRHFRSLYPALLRLNLKPGTYWHPRIPLDLKSIMPPKRLSNTIEVTELLSHPHPEEVKVAWNPQLGSHLREAREALEWSQRKLVRESRGYTFCRLSQSTLSSYESTDEASSVIRAVHGGILKAMLTAMWVPPDVLIQWTSSDEKAEPETDRASTAVGEENRDAKSDGQSLMEAEHKTSQLSIPSEQQEEAYMSNPENIRKARQMNGHGVKISLDANWTKDAQKKEMVRQMLKAAHALAMPVTINDEPWEASQRGEDYEYRTVPKTI